MLETNKTNTGDVLKIMLTVSNEPCELKIVTKYIITTDIIFDKTLKELANAGLWSANKTELIS